MLKIPMGGVCGVCGEWARNGLWLESGPLDRRTGETPCDNFICRLCQVEERERKSVEDALDEHFQRRVA